MKVTVCTLRAGALALLAAVAVAIAEVPEGPGTAADAGDPCASPESATEAVDGTVQVPGLGSFKRVEIVDSTGFERSLVAYSMLIPVRWQGGGQIVWGQDLQCGGEGWEVEFQAHSADGLASAGVLPRERWYRGRAGIIAGCPALEISSVRDYVQDLVSRTRPGARLEAYRSRPDIEESLAAFNRSQVSQGVEFRSWVEAAEAVLAYAD
ncbi:MAG: hypothetical protein ACK5HY_15590, partial [Parahaliea sp.]